jgi:GNAT superfamily N-acetyltransferase
VPVEISIESPAALRDYASIPIAYDVVDVLDVEDPPASGAAPVLTARRLASSVLKNYDAEPGNAPLDWPRRFDVSTWGVLAAHERGRRVGGAVVVFRSPGIEMLEGRADLAILWDIRVAPVARARGVGSALLGAAEGWARERGARELKVETQNTNAPACRFYAKHGFLLRVANRNAYPSLPDEIQLFWYKDL